MKINVISRLSWVHWLLAVVYGLLATGTFFKFSYELGELTGTHIWSGYIYAASPTWAKTSAGLQAWAFATLLGFTTAITGQLSLPCPPLKNI